MNKHGITIQPFIFILTLIVMALVIIFGSKSILDLKKASDFTELSVFINKLDENIETFTNFDIGSSKTINLQVPTRITTICFFKPHNAITVPIQDSFFRDVLENSARDNVFVLPLNAFPKTAFTIESLVPTGNENPLCIPTRGNLHVILETISAGNNVLVAVQQPR